MLFSPFLTKAFWFSTERALFQVLGKSSLQRLTAFSLLAIKHNFSWSWFLCLYQHWTEIINISLACSYCNLTWIPKSNWMEGTGYCICICFFHIPNFNMQISKLHVCNTKYLMVENSVRTGLIWLSPELFENSLHDYCCMIVMLVFFP